MDRIYTDYINKTAITVPNHFIDVKTGESFPVSSKVRDEIAYHADNQTLIHLVLSALNSYLHPKRLDGSSKDVLMELSEIKKMLQHGQFTKSPIKSSFAHHPPMDHLSLDMKDIEDILEQFGG